MNIIKHQKDLWTPEVTCFQHEDLDVVSRWLKNKAKSMHKPHFAYNDGGELVAVWSKDFNLNPCDMHWIEGFEALGSW
jgi:hypothetical protein